MQIDETKIKAVALVSGGLDSLVSAKLVSNMGIDVYPVLFSSKFISDDAEWLEKRANSIAQLGRKPLVIDITKDMLEVILNPKFGYGSALNPCLDCHIAQLRIAHRYMKEIGASFLITGEVIGQRGKSQKRSDFDIIAKETGFGEYVLRPLSAKLLKKTEPEAKGWVNRDSLFSAFGKSRHIQIGLANELGLTFPSPGGGCKITDGYLSSRLKEVIDASGGKIEDIKMSDIDLVWVGRHLRVNGKNGPKIVLSRDFAESEKMFSIYKKNPSTYMLMSLVCEKGPVAMICDWKNGEEDAVNIASDLIRKFYKEKWHKEFILYKENCTLPYVAGDYTELVDVPVYDCNFYHIKRQNYRKCITQKQSL